MLSSIFFLFISVASAATAYNPILLPKTCVYYHDEIKGLEDGPTNVELDDRGSRSVKNWVSDYLYKQISLQQFKTGLPPASHFDHDLLSNLSNFLGEEWITGQKSGDKKIEGGTARKACRFLLDVLRPVEPDSFGVRPEELLTAVDLSLLNRFLDTLPTVVALERLMDNISLKKRDAACAVANLFYATAKLNEEWIIPISFGSVGGSHLTLGTLELLDDNKVTFRMYNTGDGINHHASKYGRKHKRYSFVRVYQGMDLYEEILNSNFFVALVTYARGANRGDVYNANLFYTSILPRFSKYEIKYTQENTIFSIPQRTGNCYLKVFLAYLKHQLGHASYKLLEVKMHLNLSDYLFRNKMYEVSGMYCELTKRALQNTARIWTRQLVKEGEAAHVSQYSEKFNLIHSKLNALPFCRRMATVPKNFAADDVISMLKKLNEKPNDIDSIFKSNESHDIPGKENRPLIMNDWNDVEKFIGYMNDVNSYMKNSTSSNIRSFYFYGVIVALPDPSDTDLTLYDRIDNDTIDTVCNTLQNLFIMGHSELTRSALLASLLKIVAIEWKLLKVKEKQKPKLTKYKLGTEMFEQLLNYPNISRFYNPEVWKICSNSLQYLKASSGEKLLFSSDNSGGKISFIPSSSGEFEYLSEIQMDADDDARYSKALFNYKTKSSAEKLRNEIRSTIYFFLSSTNKVPAQFHHLRDYIYFLPCLWSDWVERSSTKFKQWASHEPSEWVDELTITDDYRASLDISHKSIKRSINLTTMTENQVLVSLPENAKSSFKDTQLLKYESKGSIIEFAFYCLEKYVSFIFDRPEILQSFADAFMASNALEQWVASKNDGKAEFEKHWDIILRKAQKRSMVGDRLDVLGQIYNLKALSSRWVGQKIGSPSCKLEQCPAAYIDSEGHYDLLKTGSPIPDYMIELLSHNWSKSEKFYAELMTDNEIIQRVLNIFASNKIKCTREDLLISYPMVKVLKNEVSFEYNFWTGKISKKSIYAKEIDLDELILDPKLRNSLINDQFLVYDDQQYSIHNGIVKKLIGSEFFSYGGKKMVGPKAYSSKFNFFYKIISQTEAVVSFEFKHSLPSKIAGKNFLQFRVNNWKSYSASITNVRFLDSDWNIDILRPPKVVESFADGSPILQLSSKNQKKYIVMNFFLYDGSPLVIDETASTLSFLDYNIQTKSELQDFPEQHLELTKNDKKYVVLPLENSEFYSDSTPCIYFETINEQIVAFDTIAKLQLSYYYLISKRYKTALEILASIDITSQFEEEENKYIEKIIGITENGPRDNRPEAVAVAYYAAYLLHKGELTSPAQKIQFKVPILFTGFFDHKEICVSHVLSSFYSIQTRIPSSVKPVISITSNKSNQFLIPVGDEVNFVREHLGTSHQRLFELSSIENDVDIVQANPCSLRIDNVQANSYQMSPYYSEKPVESVFESDLKHFFTSDAEFWTYHIAEKKLDIPISFVRSYLLSFPARDMNSEKLLTEIGCQLSFLLLLLDHYDDVVKFAKLIIVKDDWRNTPAADTKDNRGALMSQLLKEHLIGHDLYDIKRKLNPIDFSKLSFSEQKFVKPKDEPILVRSGIKTDPQLSEMAKQYFTDKCVLDKHGNKEALYERNFKSLIPSLLFNKVISRQIKDNDLDLESQETKNKLGFSPKLCSNPVSVLKMQEAIRENIDTMRNSIKLKHEELIAYFTKTDEEMNKCILRGKYLAGLYHDHDFDTLLRPFLLQNYSEYRNIFPYLEDSTIQMIHDEIGSLLALKISLARLERSLKELEKNESKYPEKEFTSRRLEEELKEFKVPEKIQNLVMVMEYKLGFRIRERNVKNIESMAKTTDVGYANIALQSIMGSGKTDVLSPAISFLKADGDGLALFCPPSSHFETNAAKLSTYSNRFFGQQTEIIHFDRTPKFQQVEAIRTIHEKMNSCIINRKNLLMKFESLQSLVNQFVLNLSLGANNQSTIELAKILHLMKNSVNITFDEVDFTFRTNKMFNFPVAQSERLNYRVESTLKILLKSTVLCQNQLEKLDIFPHLGITQSASKFRDDISNMLAVKFLELIKNVDYVAKFDEADMLSFLTVEPLGVFKQSGMDELDVKIWIMSQTFIRSLIFDTWGTICNFNYGPSKYCDLPFDDPMFCGVAKPFVFAGEPNESSSWANKYETAVRTFQMVLENGLTEAQLGNFIKLLQEEAIAESDFLSIEIEQTKQLRFFNEAEFVFNGKPISLLTPDEKRQKIDVENKGMMDSIMKQLKGTYEEAKINLLLEYVFEVGMAHEKFYESQITNNSQFMATRFKSCQGFSGTAQREYQFWEGVNFIPDQGASTAVEVKILQQIDNLFEVPEEMDAINLISTKPEIDVLICSDANFENMMSRMSNLPNVNLLVYEKQSNLLVTRNAAKSSDIKTIYLSSEDNIPSFAKKTLSNLVLYVMDDVTITPEICELLEKSQMHIWASSNHKSMLKKYESVIYIHKNGKTDEIDLLFGARKQVKAFIDTGAFFRSYSNQQVASRVIENFSSAIECVLFYDKDNKLSFVKRDSSNKATVSKQLTSEKPEDILKQVNLLPQELDKIFVYYDQKHILGSDFKMIDGAIAYVTIGPTTTRTDLEQSVMRMRGLLDDRQKLRFIVSSDVSRTIRSRKESGNRLTLLGIINHAIVNETEIYKSSDDSGATNKQNLQLLYQKIKAQYMDLTLSHLVEIAKSDNVEKAIKMFEKVKHWFIDQTYDFEKLDESNVEKTEIVMKAYLNTFQQLIETDAEWNILKDNGLKRKKLCLEFIERFTQDLVEKATSTPLSLKSNANMEVQVQAENENQNQNQNQNLNNLSKEEIKPVSETSSELALTITRPVYHLMKRPLGKKLRNIFGDHLRMSDNFFNVSDSLTRDFTKTPTFFVNFDHDFIIAISHSERVKFANKNHEIFYLMEGKVVNLSNYRTTELTEQQTIDLLILCGDFQTLQAPKYREHLLKWIHRRRFYRTELMTIMDAFLCQQSDIYLKTRLRSFIENTIKELGDPSILDQDDIEFTRQNPRFGTELFYYILHSNHDINQIVADSDYIFDSSDTDYFLTLIKSAPLALQKLEMSITFFSKQPIGDVWKYKAFVEALGKYHREFMYNQLPNNFEHVLSKFLQLNQVEFSEMFKTMENSSSLDEFKSSYKEYIKTSPVAKSAINIGNLNKCLGKEEYSEVLKIVFDFLKIPITDCMTGQCKTDDKYLKILQSYKEVDIQSWAPLFANKIVDIDEDIAKLIAEKGALYALLHFLENDIGLQDDEAKHLPYLHEVFLYAIESNRPFKKDFNLDTFKNLSWRVLISKKQYETPNILDESLLERLVAAWMKQESRNIAAMILFMMNDISSLEDHCKIGKWPKFTETVLYIAINSDSLKLGHLITCLAETDYKIFKKKFLTDPLGISYVDMDWNYLGLKSDSDNGWRGLKVNLIQAALKKDRGLGKISPILKFPSIKALYCSQLRLSHKDKIISKWINLMSGYYVKEEDLKDFFDASLVNEMFDSHFVALINGENDIKNLDHLYVLIEFLIDKKLQLWVDLVKNVDILEKIIPLLVKKNMLKGNVLIEILSLADSNVLDNLNKFISVTPLDKNEDPLDLTKITNFQDNSSKLKVFEQYLLSTELKELSELMLTPFSSYSPRYSKTSTLKIIKKSRNLITKESWPVVIKMISQYIRDDEAIQALSNCQFERIEELIVEDEKRGILAKFRESPDLFPECLGELMKSGNIVYKELLEVIKSSVTEEEVRGNLIAYISSKADIDRGNYLRISHEEVMAFNEKEHLYRILYYVYKQADIINRTTLSIAFQRETVQRIIKADLEFTDWSHLANGSLNRAIVELMKSKNVKFVYFSLVDPKCLERIEEYRTFQSAFVSHLTEFIKAGYIRLDKFFSNLALCGSVDDLMKKSDEFLTSETSKPLVDEGVFDLLLKNQNNPFFKEYGLVVAEALDIAIFAYIFKGTFPETYAETLRIVLHDNGKFSEQCKLKLYEYLKLSEKLIEDLKHDGLVCVLKQIIIHGFEITKLDLKNFEKRRITAMIVSLLEDLTRVDVMKKPFDPNRYLAVTLHSFQPPRRTSDTCDAYIDSKNRHESAKLMFYLYHRQGLGDVISYFDKREEMKGFAEELVEYLYPVLASCHCIKHSEFLEHAKNNSFSMFIKTVLENELEMDLVSLEVVQYDEYGDEIKGKDVFASVTELLKTLYFKEDTDDTRWVSFRLILLATITENPDRTGIMGLLRSIHSAARDDETFSRILADYVNGLRKFNNPEEIAALADILGEN